MHEGLTDGNDEWRRPRVVPSCQLLAVRMVLPSGLYATPLTSLAMRERRSDGLAGGGVPESRCLVTSCR